ncbi:hypothetical protein [Streptomyces termitum]|uniref:Uncharacterized protein n=1 Tax=Streptomyces termitum TaxID=67368 RepID=A0A918T4T3_9ACTN|nr:hypothetical protein [Streptomyces termitum]GHA87490.1 hypothetical protein GCM10010305_33880 [Streptomyces termitum]
MGRKQTRVNKGARSGGHEHREGAPAKEKGTSPESRTPAPLFDQPSHRKERKFGHN